MIYIGIDPGVSGAIAVVDSDGNVLLVQDLPTVKTAKRTKTKAGKIKMRTDIDIPVFFRLLRGLCDNDTIQITIEEVHARPGQGTTSMFAFGESYGILKALSWAASADTGCKVELVRAQLWKKHFGLTKAEKVASVELCEKLYPWITKFRGPQGGPKDGRADAVLIAEFGRSLNYLTKIKP